jgi:uncharacterized protein
MAHGFRSQTGCLPPRYHAADTQPESHVARIRTIFAPRRWLAFALLVVLGSSLAQARDLAAPESDLRQVELIAIQQIPMQGMSVLVLRVMPDGDELPIFTGTAEGEAIERAWRQMRPQRPLTHELLGDLLEATGWTLERLVIDELREEQFLAVVEISHADGRRQRIDARPSDGLALALRSGATIHVSKQVIDAVANPQDPSRQRALLTSVAR